jgi:hypothetical protein
MDFRIAKLNWSKWTSRCHTFATGKLKMPSALAMVRINVGIIIGGLGVGTAVKFSFLRTDTEMTEANYCSEKTMLSRERE